MIHNEGTYVCYYYSIVFDNFGENGIFVSPFLGSLKRRETRGS